MPLPNPSLRPQAPGLIRIRLFALALPLTLGIALAAGILSPPSSAFDLARAGGPSYAADAGERFRPLSHGLVRDLLGIDAQPDGKVPSGSSDRRAPAHRRESADAQLGSDKHPTKAPHMTADMKANRETVRPGERITYVVTVTNEGDEDMTGVQVTVHVPEGTRIAGGTCRGEVARAEAQKGERPANVCVDSNQAAPPPSTGTDFTRHVGVVRAHKQVTWTFTLYVERPYAGAPVVENHAHVTVGDYEIAHSNTVAVTVE